MNLEHTSTPASADIDFLTHKINQETPEFGEAHPFAFFMRDEKQRKRVMKKIIEVVPYDPNWPHIFEKEALLIRQAFGDNCIAIHHVGSTAVPGLAAKPKIDMIAVVQDPLLARDHLKKIGIQYRGEYNIPLHYGFSKRADIDLNIHVYEEFHPEIGLNLCFRDYLRNHTNKRDDYARLKEELIQDESSFAKENSLFTNYTLRKGDFIREVLREAGFNRIRIRFYLKNGYREMPFDDPENHDSDPNDVPVGKLI